MVHRRSLHVILALASSIALAAPIDAARRPREQQRVSGSITLNGCEVRPSQLRLVANLVTGGQVVDPTGASTPATRGEKRRAPVRGLIVHRPGDPHSFDFEIRRLSPGRLYRLSLGISPGLCPKVFWRAPARGLVVAGGAPIRIEGFAARTRIEIQSEVSARGGQAPFVGADDLQLTDPARALRVLRWTSDIAGVISGELQIADSAFPTEGAFDPCATPAGRLIYREVVPYRGADWTVLPPFDFSRALTETRTMTAIRRERILNGAPLWVRIVPHDTFGPLCDTKEDGVHGQVLVAKLPAGVPVQPPDPTPLLAAGSQLYLPPYLPPPPHSGHPTHGEFGFLVIEDHTAPPVPCYSQIQNLFWANLDPLGCGWIQAGWTQPGGTIPKGWWWYWTPGSSGGGGNILTDFGDAFVSVVTGLYQTAGLAVTTLAELSEAVKSAVTKVALDALVAVPLMSDACNGLGSTGLTTCEGLIQTGLEYGLTSMGIPPSIPNWDQVQAEGLDYLKSQVAEQVAGDSAAAQVVTDAMVDLVVEQAVEQMNAQRNTTGLPQYEWVVPYVGFTAASWTTSVAWTGSAPLPTERLVLHREPSPLFAGTDSGLPTISLPTVSELRIPLTLAPNVDSIPPPFCRTNRFGATTCVPAAFGIELCQVDAGTLGNPNWHDVPCSPQSLGIYYRDRWAAKFAATPCHALFASSFRWLAPELPLAVFLPAPTPPFAAGAFVEVATPAQWSGPFYASPACP